jgi:hypothetical protein
MGTSSHSAARAHTAVPLGVGVRAARRSSESTRPTACTVSAPYAAASSLRAPRTPPTSLYQQVGQGRARVRVADVPCALHVVAAAASDGLPALPAAVERTRLKDDAAKGHWPVEPQQGGSHAHTPRRHPIRLPAPPLVHKPLVTTNTPCVRLVRTRSSSRSRAKSLTTALTVASLRARVIRPSSTACDGGVPRFSAHPPSHARTGQSRGADAVHSLGSTTHLVVVGRRRAQQLPQQQHRVGRQPRAQQAGLHG